MRGVARRVGASRGWPRAALAFSAGAVGALAMPPFELVPALVVPMAAAIWLLDGAARESFRASLVRAALDGWLWGFGYFVAGLWWLGAAFLVEAEQFAWALPFGVIGLPAFLALYPALGFLAARLLWSPGPSRLFALAFALAAAEWLRGHLFTGFPWNAFGMALAQAEPLMQGAALVGLPGLTLLAVLISAAPALAADPGSRLARLAPTALAALALAALSVFGALRLPGGPAPVLPGVALRIMQPNLPQDAAFTPANRDAILARYASVSAGGGGLEGVTHLIWPESAFPFLLHRDAAALAQLGALLPPRATLVTGAARFEGDGEGRGRFYNAVQVVGAEGRIEDAYDKTHLVPFGEYVPETFDALIRAAGLRQFVQIPGGFAAAETRRALHVPGLPPVAASICYEAIFPGAVLPEGPRPSLILNVTNDAWFGATPGPYQHFAQARLRAVEEGLPLVRAANSGISAMVDPFGRVTGFLPLGSAGILDARLPAALPATPYSLHGDRILGVLLLICLALALAARPLRRAAPFAARS